MVRKEVVKICGLRSDEIKTKLAPFENKGVTFAVTEKFLDAKIVLKTELDEDSFDQIKTEIYNVFADEVYASMDITLEDLCAKQLAMSGKILSVAESLTGGLIASKMCSVSGISNNFYEGIVCYNPMSKVSRLNIDKSLIGAYGTVSKQTAYAMIKGLQKPPVDICLSATGVAGPEPSEGKPVGLVYIGVGADNFVTVFEKHLSGTRNEIREGTANIALFYLSRYLKGDILRFK